MDINKPIRPYDAIFTNIISRISYGVMEPPMMNIAVNSNNQQHNVIRHFFKCFFCSSLFIILFPYNAFFLHVIAKIKAIINQSSPPTNQLPKKEQGYTSLLCFVFRFHAIVMGMLANNTDVRKPINFRALVSKCPMA